LSFTSYLGNARRATSTDAHSCGLPLRLRACRRRLRNVPEKGLYIWDLGTQFGIYRPDSFSLDDSLEGP
jgi:hypothetical protein